MFTAVLAQFLLPSDRLNTQKILGIGLSAAGLLLLFAPNIIDGLTGTFEGICAATAAAFSYAVSHVYAKKYISNLKPFVAPAAQLLMSAIFMIPLALYFESPWTLPFPSMTTIGAVLGLACFGTILAFIIYYKLMEHCGPTAISTVACFFPIGGMFLGFAFLGETFTLNGMIAAVMILFGLMLVNEMLPRTFMKPKPVENVFED